MAGAVVALAVLWRLLPASSPPIYDGVCTADPYRLIGQSPAPSSASKMYPAEVDFPTSEVVTDESPPQAQILMMMDTFNAPSTSLTVSIAPVPAPPPAPPGYALDGNVYSITAVDSAGHTQQPAAQAPVTLVMRATMSTPARTMYVRQGGAWMPLRTFNAGCGDSFEAVSTVLGEFALLYQGSASNNSGNGGSAGGGFPVAVVAGIGVVAVITGSLLLARRSVRRHG